MGNADYPTERIAETSRRFRQLGLGYANLGALLMSLGLPYDSEEGRALAAAVTALLTGHAYATSARIAARMGPFAGFAENRDSMLGVLELAPGGRRSHRRGAGAGRRCWTRPSRRGITPASWPSWSASATPRPRVLAPTGTIGLMMDCDTTGVEPDLSLCKLKKLVGGGTMSIVNQSIPRALRRLAYEPEQIEEIVAYIDEHKSLLGAPHIRPEHIAVFACSMGDNVIHHLGHVKMMAAVQPFISGAISKTVNMPEEATPEDVESLLMESWRLGVKAIAIYRDNCKVAQPLASAKSTTSEQAAMEGLGAVAPTVVERIVEQVRYEPIRQKLPRRRRSSTFDFRVADCKGFVTVAEYDDGRPGELFIQVSKQGSTLAGIMDAFAISVSYGLQYGVPLRAFVETFTGMRFEPAGITDDPDIRIATSLMDYLFRRLAVEYLSYGERAELGIFTTGERTQQTLPGVEETVIETRQGSDIAADPPSLPSAAQLSAEMEQEARRRRAQHRNAPMCMQCGVQMQRAGSCHACPSCGTTSGCS